MTVESGLRAFLLANPDILALVGTRYYAGALPQKVSFENGACAIVAVFVSNPGGMHLRGPSRGSDTWQLDCWARQSDAVMTLGRLIRWRLDGFQGTWASGSDSVYVSLARKIMEMRVPEVEVSGGLYRHSSDYRITYTASEDRVLI